MEQHRIIFLDGFHGNFWPQVIHPEVGKILALLRFGSLNGAISAVEKNAGAIGMFQQRESAPVVAQARESLDKFIGADASEMGESRNFRLAQNHLSRPAAAGGAALTLE